MRLVVSGNIPILLDETSSSLWSSVAELVSNCVENKKPGGTMSGAGTVVVKFENNSVTVRDDWEYEDPNSILDVLNRILHSGRPGTTKNEPGGMGIYQAAGFFRSNGGELIYFIENDTIVAQGTWDPNTLQLETECIEPQAALPNPGWFDILRAWRWFVTRPL